MGIPGFYGRYLTKHVTEAIVNRFPHLVASLSFDLNGVFHEARNLVYGDGSDPRLLQAIANTDPLQLELEIYNTIENILIRIIQSANPRDCLILAVDGVAPGAKMQQQRGRRERSAREQLPGEKFDKNAITPGTEFMIRLDNFMVRFIAKYRDILPPKVIYSSHLVPGEGEHKIMEFYRKGEVSDGPAAQQGGVHVLYGLDADLIMLSLINLIDRIFLSRESVREIINIDKFKEYIRNQTRRPTAIDDFVVMMFLIGNDFLPHSPAFQSMSESITLLFDIYIGGDFVLTMQDETGRKRINWDSMKHYLRTVALHEGQQLATLSTQEFKYPSRYLNAALVEGQFYPDMFRNTWYQNALGAKGDVNVVNSLTQIVGLPQISAVTTDRIEKMAMDYMRTMEWVYLYYCEGTNAVNHDWAYPYYHVPMLSDLADTAQTIGVSQEINGYQAYFDMKPFTALQQLVAVLPLKSKALLPVELQKLFADDSIIRDYFPANFIVEMDGKNRDHEGVPIVPIVDRRRIIDAVAQITFTPSRVKIWLPAETQYFERTPDEAEILATQQYIRDRHTNFKQKQEQQRQRHQYKPRHQQQTITNVGNKRGRGEYRGHYRGKDTRSQTVIARPRVQTERTPATTYTAPRPIVRGAPRGQPRGTTRVRGVPTTTPNWNTATKLM